MESRIFLRAFETEDYKITSKWREDMEIMNPHCGNIHFVSSEREKKWIENMHIDDSKNVYLAICLLNSRELIGYCSINNIDLRNLKAEWGGTIIGRKDLWGKGYFKEASRLMIKYLFKEFPIHKCYGYCLEDHIVTQHVLNSFGFKQEGVLRDDVYKNGQFKSKLVYSLLRSEYLDLEDKVFL